MNPERDATSEILRRHHDGDREALPELMVRDAAWIRAFVRRKLSPTLRRHADSMDVVQEAFSRAIDALPRLEIANKRKFRALMGTIVARRIASWAQSPAIQHRIDPGTVLDLDGGEREAPPAESAAQREEVAWVRLAIQLLEHDDQTVVQLRHFDGLPFADVAARLGTTTDAARMRFGRAMQRLSEQVIRLKSGRVEELIDSNLDADDHARDSAPS